MISEPGSLLLQQHVRKRGANALICRESRLSLSPDQHDLILSRYLEQYSPDEVRWVEREYRIPVETLLRWLISHKPAGSGCHCFKQ